MARASFTHYITEDSALGGMEIERSLRFQKEANAHLSKTFSSAGNRKVWTWSAWVRRGEFHGDANENMFHAYDGSSSNRAVIGFDSSRRLQVHMGGGGGSKGQARTSALFRDVGAWYHIVCVGNYADSTAADRVKMYVNGELQTITFQVAFTDENGLFNSNIEHEIGVVGNSSSAFDGYMADIHWIDGQALDPSYFGFTDFQTGKWRPKRYEGTYGQNGFHLEFKDNSGATATTIGKDTSGNQHNFTPSNIAVSGWEDNDSFIDTPTNTFPILNRNQVYRVYNSSSRTYNGSLKYNCHYDNQGSVRASLAFPTSGKWYFEVKLLSSNANATFGICPVDYSMNQNAYTQTTTPGAIGYAAYSQILKDGSTTGGVGGWGTSDTVAAALDMDEKTITFYKNNSAQTTTALTTGRENIPYFPMLTGGTNGGSVNLGINFGGSESFAYTPPEGFKTLCTKNLPFASSPSVYNPKKHFDTLIYTGDGATGRSVTGLEFQPDFVWIKSRASGHHGIYDSIRGVQKRVIADENGAESDVPIGSFDHNGFSFASEMYYNANSVNYVAWFWKAGGTAVSNSDGSITSQVSANQEAGFSVVTYTGNGADATVGHGLGKVPAVVMVKNRSRSVEWIVKHHKMNSGKVMYLDLNSGEDAATGSNNGIIGDLDNASTFSLSRTSNSGNYNNVNYSGENFVAYCWTEIPGYSKFGLYKGNNNDHGSFVHTGFKVGWLMIKKSSGSGHWYILDNKRSPTNEVLKSVNASLNSAESTDSKFVDFMTDGFKMRTSGAAVNQDTLIYMAFAETSGNTPFDDYFTGR